MWSDVKAGGPILPGRWSALICLWIAGFLAGDVDVNFVATAIGAPTDETHNWLVDSIQLLAGFGFLVAGIVNLDRYGRNAWFMWAPDTATWAGLKREDVVSWQSHS